MLLKNECTQISSVLVELFFDDETFKKRLIAIDDLVDIVYNANGIRKHIIGRVSNISTVGADPNNWYIIVDGSDDFASDRVRFSPKAILDCEIIRKGSQDEVVKTPLGDTCAPFIRIVKGRLQYSNDGGMTWKYIKIDEEDIISGGDIDPQEGTVPILPPPNVHHHRPKPPKPLVVEEDDGDDVIEDANY